MSTRNFERVFRREVGIAPAQYVRKMRVEAARRLIERGGKGLEQIALSCGFSNADSLRRVLKQVLNTTAGPAPKAESRAHTAAPASARE
jgi:transcriptional regulator GlxA family with amidase domain